MHKEEIFERVEADGTRTLYSVNIAQLLIRQHNIPVQNLITPALRDEAIARNKSLQESPLKPEHIFLADLSKPIIVLELETEEGPRHIVIDGWHRLCKAQQEHHNENLPVQILGSELAKLCRLQ